MSTHDKAPTAPSALRYTGDGSRFLYGVPQRDLTEDDLADIGAVTVADAIASGLYEVPSKRDQHAINQAARAADDASPVADDPAPAADEDGAQ